MGRSLKLILGISYVIILFIFLYLIFSYVQINRLDDFLYYKELQIDLEKMSAYMKFPGGEFYLYNCKKLE